MRNRETNKQKGIRKDDLFYDYFKEQLAEHSMPDDDQNWSAIYSRIQFKKKKGIWIVWYYSAAAVLLLFLLLHLSLDTEKRGKLVSMTQHSAKKEPLNASPTVLPILTLKENNLAIARTTTESTCTETSTNLDNPESKEEIHVIKEGKNHSPQRKDNGYSLLASLPKKHSRWKLSATVGIGGLKAPSQGYNNIQLAASSPNMADYMFNGYNAAPNDEHKTAIYAPSFTFGILARKKLNTTFSIETGLLYSYLSTRFQNDHNSYKAHLNLHYLGIPLHLVADIWNPTTKLKVYNSAGITVEKGLKADFSEQNQQRQQSAGYEGSIQGLQWSLNTAAGLSYHFSPHWNIYLEPRLSFYFDNNQPTSIRSEKQVIVELNSGFRYDF
jgi:hypothetical protein